ncbi:single-stranded DNA-binding protein [Clostridium sp. HMP27]|uniref:single-stranded DNA-binding protein n=1 Tax=Clostridium sp. HMP27 TaxID=1487921 RepID=UPI00052C7E1D|nr:single-stranded DNA-binding protein [Clostridium sp. HMP27]KGK88011.1 single-stranded DNA-binding protein [Clostridium sp. HMP27]
MNKVILIGRLTKDPELKFTPGEGKAVTTFTIAIDRRTGKDGKKEADFIPCVVWGKQAEIIANYSGKGKQICVSGRIQTRNYDNKEGKKVYNTEVVADQVQIIDWVKAPDSKSFNCGPDMVQVYDEENPFN